MRSRCPEGTHSDIPFTRFNELYQPLSKWTASCGTFVLLKSERSCAVVGFFRSITVLKLILRWNKKKTTLRFEISRACWGNAALTFLPYNWLRSIMWPFENDISWDRGIYFRNGRPSTLTYDLHTMQHNVLVLNFLTLVSIFCRSYWSINKAYNNGIRQDTLVHGHWSREESSTLSSVSLPIKQENSQKIPSRSF